MTGIFVRVKRSGKWCNVEFELLTDKEMVEFTQMKREQNIDGWGWVITYAQYLRDTIRPLLEGLVEEGILDEQK